MQQIYFFFDDSGIFHENEKSNYFVYAGYVFVGKKCRDDAKREYKTLCTKIKNSNKIEGELKASHIKKKHRRALVNVLSKYDSISCRVKIDKIYKKIISDKLSRFRYKDYLLKRIIKSKIQELINKGIISANEDTELIISIDEQHTTTNGWYDLQNSIKEELKHGIINFDYGIVHKPILNGELKIVIKYCDSQYNYLIQASDILANYTWHYCIGDIKKFTLSKHFYLQFP